MATVTTNALTKGFRGTIGNELVFKTMRGKTFVSAKARIPDKKKESDAQRNTRIAFKQAAEWAQYILLEPEKKLYYQQRAKALKLPNAYTAAITDYMRKPTVVKSSDRGTITYAVSKRGFAVRQVSIQANETMGEAIKEPKVFKSMRHDRWMVTYLPDSEATSLTLIITDNILQEISYVDVLT